MIEGGWRPLVVEAAASLDLSPQAVTVDGAVRDLPSPLGVGDTALACVVTALTAAAGLQRQRGGRRLRVGLDAAQVSAAVRSEVHLRVNGHSLGSGFAPLSRFWRASDGWVRTHGNYPWHRQALLCALGTTDDPSEVGAAISDLPAEAVEARVIAAGGAAAAVRTVEQWRQHPHGRATLAQPLIGATVTGDAPPRHHPPAGLPAAGLRVLDLTRVIAGPVATRYLAALGASVLRVDPPYRPELPVHRYDGLPGKRSAILDARTAAGLDRLHHLLDGADIVVHGYRPGALDPFGLHPGSLAERHPGLVSVSLSAWGSPGPWAGRRGFDSLVQAACGIATFESRDGDRPDTLPCQLLDHGTGYLAAAAALEGVRRQAVMGGTHAFTLSLTATAAWLLSHPSPAISAPVVEPTPPAGEHLATLASAVGPVTVVIPPGRLDGRALAWPAKLTTYGRDEPAW